ncbi:ankyrin-1-like [Trichogramma pretiosum]|uniref:ankyrin-1-like n=1 Tax=Trichogramma pretiosum TaxID=7493 RepID=UPI000C719B41|nr:ankyrin-1-like [Trichogramma pretiosum]
MSTYDDESKVGLYNRGKLNVLKGLRRNVDWEIETERVEFLFRFDLLINDWKGQFPNLRDFFRPEEIECILKDSIKCIEEHVHYGAGERFIKFVVRTGYKDEPDVDEYLKPLLHRTTALHLAAKDNCSSYIVPELFKIYDRCDVNYIDLNGCTHFHVACKNGCDDIVEKFLEFGQDPNCLEQKSFDTPLNLALSNGCRKVVKLLLTNGADPNSADEKGRTPLHALCSRGVDDDLAEIFFQVCDAIDKTVQVDAIDNTGVTPLRSALVLGTKRIAEVLLRRGVDPNLSNKEGLTALHHIALRQIDDDLAETFFKICDDIQQTVQIDVQNELGWTPLHLAVCNSHRKLTELLLRRGVDPNLSDKEGFTALHHIALRETDDDLAGTFFKICDDIQQTVQIEVQNKLGWTPLHLAVCNSHRKLTELLLRRGVDPNLSDKEGFTALHHIALRETDDDLAGTFFKICDDIQQTVKLEVRDKRSDTPLHLALDNGLRKLTELLLRRGADPNSAGEKGLTALHYIALRETDDDLPEMFFQICDDIQQTVQIDVQNKLGRTPLHLAVRNSHNKLTELLLRR